MTLDWILDERKKDQKKQLWDTLGTRAYGLNIR